MSFNLYLAGGDSVPLDLKKTDNVGILTTFADGPTSVRKFIEKRHCKTFCDSGAYGVAHSGKKIDLDQYVEFINTTPECDVFAALDVIPWGLEFNSENKNNCAEASWQNYSYMIHHVKPEYRDKIIPTYHYSEDLSYIEKIVKGFDDYKPKYMAFGGRAGISTAELYKHLDYKFWPEIRRLKTDIKIHAFGVTVFEMLEKYPWYSADSTTWLRTGIAGNIHTRTKHKYGVLNISNQRQGHLNHWTSLDESLQKLIVNEIESRTYTIDGVTKNFTIPDLAQDYKLRHVWNCMYYKDWADNFVYKAPKQYTLRTNVLTWGKK